MNLVLIGFTGTGKSAVGKKLAKRLGWRFVDIDRLVEDAAGMTIPRIFTERGEPVFRRLERRCISRVVHGPNQVIATGGGAFMDPVSRGLLRASGPVVCLTASSQAIFQRVGRRLDSRPMLSGSANPLGRIKTLLRQRAPAYALADLTVDTSQLGIDAIVEQLWEKLSPCLCKSWNYLLTHARELSHRYGGRYIVVVNDRIVSSGQTQLEAYRKVAQRIATQHDAGIYYIPLPKESHTAFRAQPV